MLSANESLGALCAKRPLALVVFERLGFEVDDPARSVASACAQMGLDTISVDGAIALDERRLEAAWNQPTITEQIDAIVRTYHQPLTSEVRSVETAFVHGLALRDSPQVLLAELHADLAQHIEMEERVLFPLLRTGGSSVLSTIRALSLEHDELILELLTLGAVVRRCVVATELGVDARRAFARFERSVCESIHVETNVLFPRVLELARR